MSCNSCGYIDKQSNKYCEKCGAKYTLATNSNLVESKPNLYKEVPLEIQRWNWGAAGLSWIWGAFNGVWISFLAFVPVLNLFFWIVLGLKGNEWAWKVSKVKNVEEFQAGQDKWRVWGMLFIFLSLIMNVKYLMDILGG